MPTATTTPKKAPDATKKAPDATKKSATGKPAQRTTSVAVGMSLSIENTRKYGFDASAATKVSARMVALPPPAPLLAALGVSKPPSKGSD